MVYTIYVIKAKRGSSRCSSAKHYSFWSNGIYARTKIVNEYINYFVFYLVYLTNLFGRMLVIALHTRFHLRPSSGSDDWRHFSE